MDWVRGIFGKKPRNKRPLKIATEHKDPHEVLGEIGKRKPKKEKRTLGLTESQQDYLAVIIFLICAAFYAYYKVDWEYTIFPRLDLGGVVKVVPENASFLKPESFPILITGSRGRSFAEWRKVSKKEGLPSTTLVVLHAELVDIGTQLLPYMVGLANATTNTTESPKRVASTLPSVLDLVHEGVVDRIVWVRPSWSKHFLTDSGAHTYYVGRDASGALRVTCPNDYFVFKKLFAPLSQLTATRPFALQVLPASDMFRRKTVVYVTPAVVIDVDVSYFLRYDPIIAELRATGLESQESKFLRAWQGGICLSDDEAEKLRGYEVLEQAITHVFEKEVYKQPREVFLRRVAKTMPLMCNNKGEVIWANLHHVLSHMTPGQIDLIRREGLPAEAGTTAIPSDRQLKGMLKEMLKFLTRTGIPTPRLITLSDDKGQGQNFTGAVRSSLQADFGRFGIVSTVSDDDGAQGS
eukprot:TRINITY_DN25120_c0_g1_i1.p1 TRINITY_DN25120_c0_g1~~TRINITY_DN25120_c0_g1_i1.p1  ORF type:complete len:465 (-),score=99.91 TRINITY_DN25120_c0_g1_i1:81-1475(-)